MSFDERCSRGYKACKIKKKKVQKNQLKTKNLKKRRSFPTVLDDFRGGVAI